MNATNPLIELSAALASAVQLAGKAVVRVDDGTQLTASGVLWSADGVVVATSHGVERDEDLEVELADGTRLPATLLARDHDTDLAVLKVPATGLPALETVPGAEVAAGQFVLALGRPGEHGLQATFGIVGSARTVTTASGEGKLIHTDATFYPGFSGGALVDARGRFLGLINLGYRRGWGVSIGTEIVQEVVDAALANGAIRRGYLGIRTQPVELRSPEGSLVGLLIAHVEVGSAAESAGLRPGDVILRVGDHRTDDPRELRRLLRGTRAEQVVEIEFVRGDDVRRQGVKLGAQE